MFKRHTIGRRIMGATAAPAADHGDVRDEGRAAARGIAVATGVGLALWAALIWGLVHVLGRIF
ncbi:MAG: hypothetical protein ACRDJE_18905 [Dehalococcoidia bacterium]